VEDVWCKAYFRASVRKDQFKMLLNFLRFDKDSRNKRKRKYFKENRQFVFRENTFRKEYFTSHKSEILFTPRRKPEITRIFNCFGFTEEHDFGSVLFTWISITAN
jgi:hypothetical protein